MSNVITKILSRRGGPVIVEEPRWYAVYTLHRNEKSVAEKLTKKLVHAYVPLVERVRRYTRKIKRYEVPLINNYVFVHLTSQDFNIVYETEHVIKFLKRANKPIPIPQSEIDTLRKIEGKDVNVEVRPIQYTEGDEVIVHKGSLHGMRGRIVKVRGKRKFIVELYTMGIELLIDAELMTLVNTDSRAAV